MDELQLNIRNYQTVDQLLSITASVVPTIKTLNSITKKQQLN